MALFSLTPIYLTGGVVRTEFESRKMLQLFKGGDHNGTN